jgi:hypothetical protein
LRIERIPQRQGEKSCKRATGTQLCRERPSAAGQGAGTGRMIAGKLTHWAFVGRSAFGVRKLSLVSVGPLAAIHQDRLAPLPPGARCVRGILSEPVLQLLTVVERHGSENLCSATILHLFAAPRDVEDSLGLSTGHLDAAPHA